MSHSALPIVGLPDREVLLGKCVSAGARAARGSRGHRRRTLGSQSGLRPLHRRLERRSQHEGRGHPKRASVPVPVVTSVSVDEVGATTAASAGRADAGASLTENLTIAVTSPAELEMTVTAASSDAVARCSAGAPSLAGSSTVKDVTLAGVRYEPLGPGPLSSTYRGLVRSTSTTSRRQTPILRLVPTGSSSGRCSSTPSSPQSQTSW